jgi:hypothetical protein
MQEKAAPLLRSVGFFYASVAQTSFGAGGMMLAVRA